MIIDDKFYMNLAIKKAWQYQILTYPNPAVGCLILDKNGSILSCQAHKKAGFLHAEPLAVLFALFNLSQSIFSLFLDEYNKNFHTDYKNIDELENVNLDPNFCYKFIMNNHLNLLKDAKAYVSLEPCSHYGKTPPCSNLFIALKFSEVNISCIDENKVASGGRKLLNDAGIKTEVGICLQEGRELLKPFLYWQSSSFSFFKIAMSLNGNVTDGIISNLQSRTHVHELRNVIDLLVVGGNTVRVDRPTLDTRLIENGKNPDVLIYSKRDYFDKSIKLFDIKNRTVVVEQELSKIDKRLIMYEGGNNLLNLALNDKIPNLNWILIYHGSEFRPCENLKSNAKLNPLFIDKIGDGFYGWYEIVTK